MQIDFPYRFDGRGLTATTTEADHIRDMIHQFLFTSPGERVNRPDFGSGVLQLVHAPNGPELAAALQFTIRSGLQRWLGDLIDVVRLEVEADGPRLTISVCYAIRSNPLEQQERIFEGSAVP